LLVLFLELGEDLTLGPVVLVDSHELVNGRESSYLFHLFLEQSGPLVFDGFNSLDAFFYLNDGGVLGHVCLSRGLGDH
jgi:hypothetical protein